MNLNKKNNPKTITIGVDARPLTLQLSGVSRVIFEILKNIPPEKNFQFILFANKECHADFKALLKQKNIQWETGRGILAKKAGLYYNFSLPLLVRRSYPQMDIFWGSQQVVFPFLPRKIKLILTYYDLVLYYFPKAMRFLARLQQRAVQKLSVRRADIILSISAQTMNDMIEKFDYPKNQADVSLLGFTQIQPSASDIQSMYKKVGFEINNNFILAVSTIEPRKNYSTLIDAWLEYRNHSKNPLPLVIAGKRGWESQEFYDRVDSLLKDRDSGLMILEGLSDSQIAALYANCSFFCMASLYEGFGLPLLEALSFHKVALVSDLPCFHEIAASHALYVPQKSIHEWASKMGKLASYFEKEKKGMSNSDYKVMGIKDPSLFDSSLWTWKRTASVHSQAFMGLMKGSSRQ